MKKLLAGLIVSVFSLVAVSAFAGEFGDLKKKVADARDPLVAMIKDANKRGADQQKVVKDSADAVSAALAKMKAPKGKEAQFKELSDTWAVFKKTREADLVPAILSGKQADAEKLAGGIQKERMGKINALCDDLDK